MAKSIRSKAKRKLRAVKREKITAKERVRLLALQEQEEGIKMVEEQEEDTLESEKTLIPGKLDETSDQTVEVTEQLEKSKGKNVKSSKGKKVKRLKKKKKNKYKW